MSIFIQKPESIRGGWYNYIGPFNSNLWLILGISVIVLSSTFSCFHWILKKYKQQTDLIDASLSTAFFTTIGLFYYQGSK